MQLVILWLLGLATIGLLNIKSFLVKGKTKKRKLLNDRDTSNTIKRQKLCDNDEEYVANDEGYSANDEEYSVNDDDTDWIENDDIDAIDAIVRENEFDSDLCPENTRHFEPLQKGSMTKKDVGQCQKTGEN